MMVLPLDGRHDRAGFDCGQLDLNVWIKQIARQHAKKRVSVTYVASFSKESSEIVGYFAISPTEMDSDDFPEIIAKRLPEKVPVFRLGRLAIARAHQGRKIGETLLVSAVRKAERASRSIGGIGVVVDAKPQAIGFYLKYGFVPMLQGDGKLILPF